MDSREDAVPNRTDVSPWVVVAHDMQRLRLTDFRAIDSSPWRFAVHIRGIQGLPLGITHIAVFWKTKAAQVQTARLRVGGASSRFERGCLSVDTNFAVDPWAGGSEITRDKMMQFTVKGYQSSEEDDASGLRMGSFSFRCMQVMLQSPVGRPSRIFKVAVDSASLSHATDIVVSLSVDCFPVWMAPAFGCKLEERTLDGDGGCEARLKETLAQLTALAQEYIASRSLLSDGCVNGSVALLDPIFRSPLNLAGRELMFPSPPFPKCVLDSSFSAVMAPALLQESIAVNIWRVHQLTNDMHVQFVRKKLESVSAIVDRGLRDAAYASMQLIFKSWATRCDAAFQKHRLWCCALALNRSCERFESACCLRKVLQAWQRIPAARAKCWRRSLRVRFFCFQEWKNRLSASNIDRMQVRQRGTEQRLQEAHLAVKELEREVVLLKSKIAGASATAALKYGSRPEHLQQLHVSRAAELSAIHRAEEAEDVLAGVRLENELLREQLEEQMNVVSALRSQQNSTTLKLQEADVSFARAQLENAHLIEQDQRLRADLDREAIEKIELVAEVQSLRAALKQQVTMMMKRTSAAGMNRS